MAPSSPAPAQAPARLNRERKAVTRFADEPPPAVRTKRTRGGGKPSTSPSSSSSSGKKMKKKAKHAEKDDALAALLGRAEDDDACAAPDDAPPEEEEEDEEPEPEFYGDPFPADEARSKWPGRYRPRAGRRRRGEDVKARRHYGSAKVKGVLYALGDDVYVTAPENEAAYIGRITEFFEDTDKCKFFTCRWFFRPEDTVIERATKLVDYHQHDQKRVFLSEHKNDNVLGCIKSKLKIVQVDPNMDPEARAPLVADADFYYDMSYDAAYSTFANISSDIDEKSGISSDADSANSTPVRTASLLDMYSSCGGMSTGLCLGAALAGLNLETRWAVDLNSFACKSLKHNHPRTEVRNEKIDDFLALLKEWYVLCNTYLCNDYDTASPGEDEDEDGAPFKKDEFMVKKIVDICYGGRGRKNGIYFKVQWKGNGPKKDTWEPIENMSGCPLKIKEFVQEGHKQKILPLPGDVDVICGGPPCQDISGFNRFRDYDEPLKKERNQQIVTFMDVVAYLQPKLILMENVVDILKFADGYLCRYSLSRLVGLNYQARLGIMAAGCYGLPQFRMRVFLWGALPSMVLPKYPLPTHDAIVRGGPPKAFSQSIVGYYELQKPTLKAAVLLGDAIRDLPKVENYQPNDEIEYGAPPESEFQCYIRLSRKDMLDNSFDESNYLEKGKLFDHQPLTLNQDDLERVLQIPVEKGANFRHLTGVMVGENNKVEFDPEVKRVYLKSGKPLVQNYAMRYKNGKSSKPFGRLWWDETVSTVVTRAEPHNQVILHPEQARVLTVRENARLQGFPDYYRLYGSIKEKYIQVGNAVAVPVARALGYSLGRAYQGQSEGSDPLFVLPESFSNIGPSEVVKH